MSKSPAFQEGAKELRRARAAGLPLFGAVALFSAVVNLLMLAPVWMQLVHLLLARSARSASPRTWCG